MRHGNALRQLSRDQAHRKSLLKNLTGSLFLHERITTTVAKAKELRKVADKVITCGKRGYISGVQRGLFESDVVKKVMDELVPRYAARPGGYCRVVRIGSRQGDGADMAVVELVGRTGELSKSVRWHLKSPPRPRSEVAAPVTAASTPLAQVKREAPLAGSARLANDVHYAPPRYSRPQNWRCAACSHVMVGHRQVCHVCGTPKAVAVFAKRREGNTS